jgi:hypothetical protein
MDESKAKASSGRRSTRRTPCVEALEGRRLLSSTAAQVGVAEGQSQGAPTLLIMGTTAADVININDNGTGAAGNITVTLGNGQAYTSKQAITEIEVMGRRGNDQISYTLSGNLVAPRTVLVYLGKGNAQFLANINGAVDNPAGLDLEAYGGTGNDVMTINQSGQIKQGTFIPFLSAGPGHATLTFNGTGSINGGATLNPAIAGGPGSDTIVSNYSGTIDGRLAYNMTIHGGRGHDDITDNIHVGPGSVGTIGTSATTPALVKAGTGKSHIHYAVTLDPTASGATVYAEVMANRGDTVERTANVVNGTTGTNDQVIAG